MKQKIYDRIKKLDKKEAVELAVYAAEQVIDIYEGRYPGDPRPRNAIEAAKRWLADPSEENRLLATYASNSAYASNAAYASYASYAACVDTKYTVEAAHAAYDYASDAHDAEGGDRREFDTKIEKWLDERGK